MKMESKLCVITLPLILYSCMNYTKQLQIQNTKDQVFIVMLPDDSVRIHEYLYYHHNIWPEVEAGFKKAGYENIRLFIFGNILTMIVSIPEGASLDEMSKISQNYHEKVKKWNVLMASYQQGVPGTSEGQTWVEMQKIYEFKSEK